MAEELIDSYIDREGVKGDTDFMLKQLNELYDSFKKLETYKFDLGGAKNFSVAGEAVKKLKIEMDELQRIEQSLIKTYEKRQAQTSDQARDLATERELLRQKNLELKNTVKESIAAANSIDEMRAKLNLMTQAKNKLPVDSSEYKKAEKDVNDLTTKLKALEAAAGDHRRNVGNYTGAIKVLEGALNEVKTKLDEYNRSGKVSKETIEALTREEGLLTQLVQNQANGFASATAEVRNNEKALQALGNAGLKNTEFYKELLQQTGNLKNSVDSLKDKIHVLGSETRTIDGLVQGAQLLAGTYGIASASAELFGAESENLQKAMVKMQAITVVLNGLQGIQNALKRESALITLIETARTKAAAAAQTLYAFATAGTTTAMKALRIALISTGIGAIVVLLGEAAAAMTAFADETDDATDGVDGLSLALSRLNDTAEASVKGLNTTTQIVLEYAKQRGATEKELSDITKKSYLAEAEIYRRITDAKITEVQKFLKAVSPNTIIKSAGDAKAALDQLKFDKASGRFKDYTDQQTKQLEGIENTLQDIVTSNTAALDAMDKARLTSAQADTKIIEEQRANAKKLADERDKRRQDYIDRERKAQFELLKLEKEGEIKRLNNIATSQDFSFQDRIQARLDMYEAERSLAIAQKEFELKNDKLTASERELVIAQAAAKIKEIEQQSAKDIIAIRKSIREKEQADIAEALAYGESETEKGTQRQITSATKVFENNIKLIEDQAEEEARILLEKYTSGIIGKETYEAEKLALENRTRRASLLAEIEHQEKLIKIMILSPEAAAEAEKKLAALKKQLKADEIKDEEETAAKSEDIQKKRAEALKQLANEVKETAFAFLTAGLEAEKNKTQEQIDALELKKQKDIEVANQSIANVQERAAAIAVIEARAAAQKEQLEKRKRQLDEQRARYDRAKNIADVIQNTAVAVIGAFKTDPTGILAAIIGAIGAAQIARVLATPIPKYAKGTKDHPGGLAVVGDGGKSELVQLPTGETYKTPARTTLTYLPKHTVVHPDADALQNMAMRSINRTMAMAQMSKSHDHYEFQNMTSAITGKLDQLNRTIKNKTEVIVRTPSMRDLLFNDGGSFREYLNRSL